MAELVKAARAGDYDRVVKLVSQGREDVNEVGPQYNLTALHLASLHDHLDIVQFLLDNGADTDVQDDWRCTPLHNAAGAGHVDIVRELCEAGAKLDVRSMNKGKTPLEIARDKGKFEVIPVLQDYMSRAGRKSTKSNGRNDTSEYARGVGGTRTNVVIRRSSGGSSRSHNFLGLPGQVNSNSWEQSARFVDDKKKLHKQLVELERAEQMHRLAKEHNRTREEFEQTRGKYDRDLEDMIKDMERMQKSINDLAGERDTELSQMEVRLHDIQDSMYQLERSPSRSSRRSDSGDRRSRNGSGKSNRSHNRSRNRSKNRSHSRSRRSDDSDRDSDDDDDRRRRGGGSDRSRRRRR